MLVVWGVNAWQTRNLQQGETPGFSLQRLDGGLVNNDSLRGKPTMLVFWAPWCGVCRASSQNVSWVQSWVGDRAQVLSIASQYTSEAEVRRYVAEQDVDYPVLLGGRETARAFGVRAYPTVFFLDEEGAITRSVVGYTTTLGMYLRL